MPEVFGNSTELQESVDKMLNEGHDVVLEIDWQGGANQKRRPDRQHFLFCRQALMH